MQEHLNTLSDGQLISLIRKGNQLAFSQLYERYWKKLYIYAYNILNNKELSEDVLHEVFTNVWLNKKTLEIFNIQGYLLISVRNRAISTLNKVRTFTELDKKIVASLKIPPEVDSRLNYQDLKESIYQATQDLQDRCREIFFMSRYEGYSNKEIAHHFKISQRTVENQLSIALKHIRSYLDK